MALFLLQACGSIRTFEQCPAFGDLDKNKFDFLVQASNTEKQDSIFAIQVKSCDRAIVNKTDGKIYINAHNKSLQEIADDIKKQISSPETTSIPVSEFSEDTSKWLDTLIRSFSKKTTQAG